MQRQNSDGILCGNPRSVDLLAHSERAIIIAHAVLVPRIGALFFLAICQFCMNDERPVFKLDVNFLQGDYAKANQKLGWEPKVKFNQLVEIMVKEDLSRWERWQKGKRFPWDAPSYPSEDRILSRMLKLDR